MVAILVERECGTEATLGVARHSLQRFDRHFYLKGLVMVSAAME
jgi:hypothetical protein